jgi:uncharacterized protein (DUF2267 family)
MPAASFQELVHRLRALAPFSDESSAELALVTTVDALRGRLTADERALLAQELPAELAQILRRPEPFAQGRPGDVFERVAAREHVRLGLAVEHAEVVCRALGETASPTLRARLVHTAPELARLFQLLPEPEPPLTSGASLPAAPRDAQGDRKLSTARGLTQESEQRSLASGRPGSKRPLSGRR